MTQEEIIEGNKLIAEFIGFDYNRSIPGHGGVTIITLSIHDCRYNSSWDWLIPVIKKMDSLKLEDGILVDDSVMTYVSKAGAVKRALMRIDILKTWLTTVEFIKWYNNQKQ